MLAFTGLQSDPNITKYSQLMENISAITEELQGRHKSDTSRIIVCTKCQHMLAYQHQVSQGVERDDLDKALANFASKFVDDFWKGYRPVHNHVQVGTDASDCLIMEPVPWMIAQYYQETETTKDAHVDGERNIRDKSTGLFRDNIILHCPQCHVECGCIRPRSLSLCRNHLLVDCFVLKKDSVRNKRLLNNR
jgi:hypothetical protein